MEKRKCHYTTIQKHLKKKNCKSEHKTVQIKATSTRIRIRWKRILDIWELKHGGGWENVTYSITFNLSNAGGSTRIRYAIYISSLLASRHAQTEPVMWFRGILNLVAILSTMTRRACTLSHQAGTSSPWTNPNRPWRGSEWKRFTRLCLDLKDSII